MRPPLDLHVLPRLLLLMWTRCERCSRTSRTFSSAHQVTRSHVGDYFVLGYLQHRRERKRQLHGMTVYLLVQCPGYSRWWHWRKATLNMAKCGIEPEPPMLASSGFCDVHGFCCLIFNHACCCFFARRFVLLTCCSWASILCLYVLALPTLGTGFLWYA
jgi:hypothetical protein